MNSLLIRKINLFRAFQKLNVPVKSNNLSTFSWETIASSSIVQFSQTNLVAFHEWTHLPWIGEIALVTIAARFAITFPLTIKQRRLMRRFEALSPEIKAFSQSLNTKMAHEAYIYQRSKQRAALVQGKALKNEINRLVVRDNCHPAKIALVPLFQIPVWIVLSNSLRNLARLYPDASSIAGQNAFLQLQQQGALWFVDLTLPDATGVLTLATAFINLTIIQLLVHDRKRRNLPNTTFTKVITNGSRVLCVALIPFGFVSPAAMTFYWFVSSSMGLLQNALLLNPKIKQLFKIEITIRDKK